MVYILAVLQDNAIFLIIRLDFFICISNVIPFPGFPSKNPLSPPPTSDSSTYTLPLPGPGIPLHWSLEPSQDQGPLLHLMTN